MSHTDRTSHDANTVQLLSAALTASIERYATSDHHVDDCRRPESCVTCLIGDLATCAMQGAEERLRPYRDASVNIGEARCPACNAHLDALLNGLQFAGDPGMYACTRCGTRWTSIDIHVGRAPVRRGIIGNSPGSVCVCGLCAERERSKVLDAVGKLMLDHLVHELVAAAAPRSFADACWLARLRYLTVSGLRS